MRDEKQSHEGEEGGREHGRQTHAHTHAGTGGRADDPDLGGHHDGMKDVGDGEEEARKGQCQAPSNPQGGTLSDVIKGNILCTSFRASH